MNDTNFLDFLSALGEEWCQALEPIVGFDSLVPQDAYEVFLRAFERPPSPELLASLTDLQLTQLQ